MPYRYRPKNGDDLLDAARAIHAMAEVELAYWIGARS